MNTTLILKQMLIGIYAYVDGIEPFVLLFAAILYLVHFFTFPRTRRIYLLGSVFLIAVSLALSVAIITNRFL